MGMGTEKHEIVFSQEVELFLDELLILLFEKEYFAFPDSAKQYVDNLISYVEQNISIHVGKEASAYYSRYGQNLKYITYRANKMTSWYIFYQERNGVFLIRYITNNHVAAHLL
ncbi:MAG: hypothetical protein LBE18_03660 [Planctomycetaceae bacterium]|jgi:hypothetical protein|nr:hypothetical protein [Planctomycetaceae bacterium]